MALNFVKFLISIVAANLIRLLRFIPNNDPIMSIALPYSRNENVFTSFLFPFLTMVSFDLITGFFGGLTIVTGLTYGVLGVFFHFYFKSKKKKDISMKTYLGCGAVGVLVFDFITGVIASPFFFGMSFEAAFVGQIPFTIMHLLTSSAFIIVVTPLIDKNILRNKHLEDSAVLQKFSSLLFAR